MSTHSPQQPRKADPAGNALKKAISSRSITAVPSIEPSALNDPDQRSSALLQKSPAQPIFRVPQSPRTATGESQAKAAKVAIPRLKRTIDAASEGSTRSGGRHRVNHACEPCRHRKTKCSGERPVCRHCQDFRIVCFYADGKRDRVKKQFGSMAEKVADYEKLLNTLISKVSEEDAKAIKASLDKASNTELEESLTDPGTAASVEVDTATELSGEESDVSGRAGSTGALDRTDEDFTREGAKATGFMGKNSDVTWMQRVRQENRYGESPPPSDADEEELRMHNISSSSLKPKREPGDCTVPLAEAADGFAVHDSSYHLDDLTIDTYETVDPYEMPPPETARILFDTYMQRIYPTFPIIGQVNLTAQFHRFVSKPMQNPPDMWLAIVNMIFAISAKYSHLIQAEWKSDDRDHLIYFSRARMLAIGQDTFFNHPDLQLIQVMGLMAFYLMAVSQINRAWTLTGTAIRHAVALGLNMRNDSSILRDHLKEIRYRLWWSLYTLEHRLCSITGRVSCILENHSTTPLPVPIDESKFDTEEGRKFLSKESQQSHRAPLTSSSSSSNTERSRSSIKSDQSQSPSTLHVPNTELDWAKDALPSSSLYFLHMVQLSRLTQNIFQQLYNPAAVEHSWSYIQSQIRQLNDQLDYWYRNLPTTLDFRRKQRDRDFYEFRLNLGFFYYGNKQLVSRPCLCRLDRKLPNQSNKSREFNRTYAAQCVESAQDMLRLIPDEPNAIGLMRVGPWWCILPYLVQSASVLLLEISFRAHHMPEDADSILESSKKAIRWLHALGEENLSARRAWVLCNGLLHDAATKIGRNVKDLPTQPPGRESVSSSDGATNMSEHHTNHMANLHAQYDQSDLGTSHYANSNSVPAYAFFPSYEQMMQYDQYYPVSEGMNGSMAGMSHLPFAASSDPNHAEMDFMSSAYHNDQAGQH